jgi:hypothetical protein
MSFPSLKSSVRFSGVLFPVKISRITPRNKEKQQKNTSKIFVKVVEATSKRGSDYPAGWLTDRLAV